MDQHAMRTELLDLLKAENAHESWQRKFAFWTPGSAITRLPGGSTPNGGPLNVWAIVEHMRICQHDILTFSLNRNYRELSFPEDYWPHEESKVTSAAWHESVESFLADLFLLMELARDQERDLFAPLPHAASYTLFREILLVADHNSYHLGQLGLLEELAKRRDEIV